MTSAAGETSHYFLFRSLARHVTDRPNAPAFVTRDIVVTYRQLAQAIARVAAFVAARGLAPGMLAAVQTNDPVLHILMVLGCELAGAGTISLTPAEAREWDVELAGCDVAFVTEGAKRHPCRVLLDASTQRLINALPLSSDWLKTFDNPPPPPAVARVLNSSGTTGTPKVIALGSAALAAIIRQRCDLISRFGPKAGVFVCTYLPTYDRSLTYVRAMLHLRRMVSFSFSRWPVDEDGAQPAWFTLSVTGNVRQIVGAYGRSGVAHKAEFIDIAGAAVDPRTHDLAMEKIAARVVENYGMKEATGISLVDRDGVGSLCSDVRIRIDRDPALSTPEREVGLISVNAPTAANGYLWTPDLSAAHFVDGWFRTDDIGFQPTPDRLVVLGRADEVLNVGGVKFAPGPLEDAICANCEVSAAVLLAIPDADGVNRLGIAVERAAPTGDPSTQAYISQLMGPLVGDYKLTFLSQLPRNEGGKIQRNLLRAALGRSA